MLVEVEKTRRVYKPGPLVEDRLSKAIHVQLWSCRTIRMASLNTVMLWIFISGTIYGLFQFVIRNRQRRRLNYPPGPTGLPFLGNVQPVERPSWVTYRNWSDKYGM